MAKPNKDPRREDRIHNPVPPDQKVPLELSSRERELILQHTFAGDELTGSLRIVPTSREASVYYFTLDDLEELAPRRVAMGAGFPLGNDLLVASGGAAVLRS